MYFTKNRAKRYVDVLQDLVESYNETPHTSLNNTAPQNVTKANEADIWAYQYLIPVKKSVKLVPCHLKVNDMVRVSHENTAFKRAHNEQFSKEIFKVAQRFRMQSIPVYKIKDFSNELIKGNLMDLNYKKSIRTRTLSGS